MNTRNELGSEFKGEQELVLKSRSELALDGVEDVIDFDETLVSLSTVCGGMSVEGEGMHISFLDIENGKLTLRGRISSIYYTEKKKSRKGGLFAARER